VYGNLFRLPWRNYTIGEGLIHVITALQDSDAVVRAQVVMALSHFPSEQVLAALSAALYDPDEGVRYFAVDSLRRVGNLERVEALIAAAGYTEG
jgi:HEAT repeat protein